MIRPGRALAGLLVALLGPATASGVALPPAETVTGIELVSPHRLPEPVIRLAIGDLEGRPLSRAAVRDSLERLWALGLFAGIRVEQVREPGGVRLRYHLDRLPHVRTVAWRGDLGLEAVDLAGASAPAVGEAATPERLARARNDLLALYRREGFLAAEVELEAREVPETNARDVAFVLRAGARARVGRLDLVGVDRVARPILTRALGVEAGDRYREAKVRDGVRAMEQRLVELGFFEARVRLEEPRWDRGRNQVDLRIEVEEGRWTRVAFEGNTPVKDAVLRERLTFRDSRVVDEFEVRASADQLEAAYRERGHHFVQVRGFLTEDREVRVVRYVIEEGPRVTVEAVEFSGNVAVPDRELREPLQTRPPTLLDAGLFKQEDVDRDRRVLLGLLRRLGYARATVGLPRVSFSEDRQRARILIPIREGPRLTVGRITAEGATILRPEEITGAIPLRAGDPWDPARAEEGRRVLERLYARRGYHGVRITFTETPRDPEVDVRYEIAEGERTRVGRVLVRGLTRTRERVVRRELAFDTGSAFNPEALSEAQGRLARTRLFERVEVEPLRPPPVPFADVELTLREARPWRLDFGLGYSTEEGFRGFLEVGHDNLFGTGRSAGLRARLSERGLLGELVYREPWLLGTRWDGDARLFHETREEIGFSVERIGTAAGIERDFGPDLLPGLRGSLRYRLERRRRFDVDATLQPEAGALGAERVASLTPAVTLDRRDSPVDPRRGSLHFVSVEGGAMALGGQANFLKSRLETHWFFDWLRPTVLALSARLGLATPLGDTERLPIEDRFFAGGSTTVRGYRENRLGPRDAAGNPLGGEGLLIVSAEWRFPLWRWIGGALFLDAGAVTAKAGDLSPSELFPGAGAGLRINTPVGPLRLDAGYALRQIEEDGRLRFHLTVGHPF